MRFFFILECVLIGERLLRASEGGGEINTIGFLVATPRPGAQRPQGRAATAAELEANYTFRHGAAPVAPALMRVLLRRRQQIGQVELVGAVAPYLSLPAELAGRRVIHFIDNTSALAALAKGYSGVPNSAHIVLTGTAIGVQIGS